MLKLRTRLCKDTKGDDCSLAVWLARENLPQKRVQDEVPHNNQLSRRHVDFVKVIITWTSIGQQLL